MGSCSATPTCRKAIGCRRSRSQPGSVGQPRDGDPDAGYAVLDTQTDEVDLHRVAYDIDRVEAVADAGLPERTAARLYKRRVRDENGTHQRPTVSRPDARHEQDVPYRGRDRQDADASAHQRRDESAGPARDRDGHPMTAIPAALVSTIRGRVRTPR